MSHSCTRQYNTWWWFSRDVLTLQQASPMWTIPGISYPGIRHITCHKLCTYLYLYGQVFVLLDIFMLTGMRENTYITLFVVRDEFQTLADMGSNANAFAFKCIWILFREYLHLNLNELSIQAMYLHLHLNTLQKYLKMQIHFKCFSNTLDQIILWSLSRDPMKYFGRRSNPTSWLNHSVGLPYVCVLWLGVYSLIESHLLFSDKRDNK